MTCFPATFDFIRWKKVTSKKCVRKWHVTKSVSIKCHLLCLYVCWIVTTSLWDWIFHQSTSYTLLSLGLEQGWSLSQLKLGWWQGALREEPTHEWEEHTSSTQNFAWQHLFTVLTTAPLSCLEQDYLTVTKRKSLLYSHLALTTEPRPTVKQTVKSTSGSLLGLK